MGLICVHMLTGTPGPLPVRTFNVVLAQIGCNTDVTWENSATMNIDIQACQDCTKENSVLYLTGVNLEIADAAFHSGFNTFNHEALMNLIWSVKRVIVKSTGQVGGGRPPKDPIYPDRFRPSGVGDNTKRKRHIETTNSPPPFHPIVPLGSWRTRRNNRKTNRHNKKSLEVKAAAIDQVLGPARIQKVDPKSTKSLISRNVPLSRRSGTQAEPINLLSDSEDETGRKIANISAKRQKTSANMGRYKVEAPALYNDHSSGTPLIDLAAEVQAHSKIITALNDVKDRLQAAKKSMAGCQVTMRDMFNKNEVKLGEDVIFPMMENLSKEIYRAHDGARDGIVEVVRSVEWLEADGLRVKDEIN